MRHEWAPDGYCHNCHNVHQQDAEADQACLGRRRRRLDPEDVDIAGVVTNGGDVMSDADPGL